MTGTTDVVACGKPGVQGAALMQQGGLGSLSGEAGADPEGDTIPGRAKSQCIKVQIRWGKSSAMRKLQ